MSIQLFAPIQCDFWLSTQDTFFSSTSYRNSADFLENCAIFGFLPGGRFELGSQFLPRLNLIFKLTPGSGQASFFATVGPNCRSRGGRLTSAKLEGTYGNQPTRDCMILDGGIPVFGSEQFHNFVQMTRSPCSTTNHRTVSKSFISGWFPLGATVIIVTEDRRLCDVGRSFPTAVASTCRLRAKTNPWRKLQPLFHLSHCRITCYNLLSKRA